MNKHSIFVISLLSTVLTSCIFDNKPISPSEYILYETFDRNSLGWIEESASAHNLDIREGYYYIYSNDSASARTSTAPLKDNFLYDLPERERYEIFTELEVTKENQNSSFGLMLVSATITYNFEVYENGLVEVDFYDYNNSLLTTLISDSTTLRENTIDENYILYLLVDRSNFEFYVNNHLIGEGQFNAQSWMDLRLYSGNLTEIKVDYLKVR